MRVHREVAVRCGPLSLYDLDSCSDVCARGIPKVYICLAIAVATGAEEPVQPCGACRQVLQEFCSAPRSLRVLIWTAAGVVESRLADLLPDPFSPEDLLEGD